MRAKWRRRGAALVLVLGVATALLIPAGPAMAAPPPPLPATAGTGGGDSCPGWQATAIPLVTAIPRVTYSPRSSADSDNALPVTGAHLPEGDYALQPNGVDKSRAYLCFRPAKKQSPLVGNGLLVVFALLLGLIVGGYLGYRAARPRS